MFLCFYHPLSVLSVILHIKCSKGVFWFLVFLLFLIAHKSFMCVFVFLSPIKCSKSDTTD